MAKTKVPGGYIADGSIAVAHLHSSHGITTDNIAQGSSNKYYSDAQVDTRLAASKSTNITTTGNLLISSDTGEIKLGAGPDLFIKHDGSNSYMENYTGDLYIKNFADDKDILIQTDDGSGGTATYMNFDGSNSRIVISKNVTHSDNIRSRFGGSNDLQIYHQSSDNTSRIVNGTGDLYITNTADDKDIIFRSDDGSGGTTTYFFLDGSAGHTKFSANTMHTDSVNAIFGTGSDLLIFHDGSNSFVHHNGTGALKLKEGSADAIVIDGGVTTINHSGSARLTTTSGGVEVTGQVTASTNLQAGSSSFLRFAQGSSTTPSILFGDSSGTGGTLSFKRNSDSAVAMSIDAAGNLNAINGIRINGTEVISGGRNLSNIGTISSGNITAASAAPIISISDTNNGGGGGASGILRFKNTSGDAMGIGYTHDVVTDSDMIISTNAGGTYGGYLGLDANGITDAQSDIILEPKTNVRIATGSIEMGTTAFIDQSRNMTVGTIDSGNITSTGTINMNHDSAALYLGADIDLRLTHNGSVGTLKNDTGNFIIDAAADIHLDADGGDVTFLDGGTAFVQIRHQSGDVTIQSNISDKDIKFIGSDGGSDVTALTLDMSDAGAASFNSDVTVGGNLTVSGSTTTLNTATLTVEDLNITVGKNATSSSATNGAGLTFGAWSSGTIPTLTWNHANTRFNFNKALNVEGAITATANISGADVLATSGSNQIQLAASNGAIEITRSSSPFIDFKTSTSHDFDSRIMGGSALQFTTGGNGSANLAFTLSSSQAATFEGNGIFKGELAVGVSDTTNGMLKVHGGATGNAEGGEIRLQTAADHDSTYDFYRMDVYQDDFRIGRQGQTDLYIFQDGSVKVSSNFESSGNILAQGYYRIHGSGVLLQLEEDAWTNADTHQVLYNGWTTSTGDYIYLAAAGNGTPVGTIVVSDSGGFYYGTKTATTGAITDSATAPLTNTRFRVDTSGNVFPHGNISIGGTATDGNYGVYLQDNHWLATQYSSSHDVVRINANTAGGLDIYNQTDSGFANIRVGSVNIGSTAVIDGSRNLANIGNISSSGTLGIGAITTSGHIQQNNAQELRGKDTSGNVKTLVRVNSSNELEYGWSGNGKVKIMGGGAYTERFSIGTNGAITFNSAYTFPTSDGSSGQVLVSNGSGALSFADQSGSSGTQNLDAVDDRDMAPEDYGYTNDFRVFFTTKEGLEAGSGTGSDYQDAIYLNSYSDSSGGDANLLAFDKNSYRILHYHADQAATNWGTPKTLAYLESPSFTSTADATPAIIATNSGGINSTIQRWVGDSDSLEVKNISTGDYKIANSEQGNGIVFYDGTGGVEIQYNGSTVQEWDSNGGTNIISGGLKVAGTSVISNGRVLQNVTANASIITAGTLGTARIPDLAASKITSGRLSDARMSTEFDETLIGHTAHSLVNFTSQSDYDKRAGYSTMMRGTTQESSVVNTPEAQNYWFYNVHAKRDTGGGTAATLIGYDSPNNFYSGFTTTSSGAITWAKHWTDRNDGTGSGLDADTVDGVQAANIIGSTANTTITANDASNYPRITKNNASAQLGLERTGSSAGVGYIGADSAHLLNIYNSSFSKKASVATDGTINAVSGYQVNGTTRINSVGDIIGTSYYVGSTAIVDTSRNLTNMGTGNFAGNVTIDYTGNSTNDAGLYVANDASDWGVIIDKDSTATYGLKIAADGAHVFTAYNSSNTEKFRIDGNGHIQTIGSIFNAGSFSGSSYVQAGRGGGGVCLTINDGQGNANVTFNHQNGTPEQAGNCGRITVNTDSTTGAKMTLELVSNSGTSNINTPSAMELTETGVFIPQYLYHLADTNTYVQFTADRVRIAAGGTVKFDSNNTYLTSHQDISGKVDIGSGFSDNRVLTAANSDTAQGESNLTFNGSTLAVTGALTTSGAITASGDILAPGIYVGSANTSYDFYNNGTSYLNGATTVDANLTISSGDLYIPEYIYHSGDTNTYFRFTTDAITLRAGGKDMINIIEGSDDYVEIDGRLQLRDGIDLQLRHSSATSGGSIHLPRAGMISFYGDSNRHHSIYSGNQTSNETDDIMISSYGSVFIDLDSNSNNSSGANFVVGRHNSNGGNRLHLDGEDGDLVVAGDVTAFGSPSDIKLKENIETIDNPIDKVKELRGVTFNYKKDGKKSTGLIAQELEKVLPEVVYETNDIDNEEDKFKAVRYGNIVGLLVEAIKEQQKEIDELKEQVKGDTNGNN